MADGIFTGVVLTVRDGQVLNVRSVGFVDGGTRLPWSAATPTQIASISKQFAAVVALLLADCGVLDLDDAVRRHQKSAPPRWDDVSLRQLITHTAGVSHWSEAPGFVPATSMAAAERLERIFAAPLHRPPGTEWRYSSPGYIVLASALGAAAGRPYQALVRDLIIDRLGLAATTVGEIPREGARGYRGESEVASWNLETMPGTGDIWSSATDLAAFLAALHSGQLLPTSAQKVFREMQVPRQNDASDGALRTTSYGCGHFIGTVRGAEARLHPGDNPGYLSLAAWLPQQRSVIVALSNDEKCDIEAAVVAAVDNVLA